MRANHRFMTFSGTGYKINHQFYGSSSVVLDGVQTMHFMRTGILEAWLTPMALCVLPKAILKQILQGGSMHSPAGGALP